jgi:hypothetical protein
MAIAPLLTAALLAVAAPAYADGMSPLQRWTRQHHLHRGPLELTSGRVST